MNGKKGKYKPLTSDEIQDVIRKSKRVMARVRLAMSNMQRAINHESLLDEKYEIKNHKIRCERCKGKFDESQMWTVQRPSRNIRVCSKCVCEI